MAEIEIQKKGPPVWPWILGVLALVVVVWAAIAMMDRDGADEFAASTPTTEQQPMDGLATADAGTDEALPAELTQFEEECSSRGTTREQMSLSHDYLESCVRSMTAALAAVVALDSVNGEALAPQLDELRERATQLTQNRTSREHGQYVQNVFTGVASLVARIEDTRSDGATRPAVAAPLQSAAEAISPDQAVLEQRDQVAAFFDQAGTALRELAAPERRGQ